MKEYIIINKKSGEVEEKILTATQALTFIQDTLSDHGTALTKTEVDNLLHGITATLAKITK